MSRLAYPFAIAALLFGACTIQATQPEGGEINGVDAGDDDDDQPDAAPGAPDAGPTGGDGGPTPENLLNEFGACMTLADWDANNLGLVALTETVASGNCATCHSAGQNGNYLNADSELTFQNIRTYPYILKWAVVDAQGNFSVSTAIPDKQLAPNHPDFTLDPLLEQGIIDFFDLTLARYELGNCVAP